MEVISDLGEDNFSGKLGVEARLQKVKIRVGRTRRVQNPCPSTNLAG